MSKRELEPNFEFRYAFGQHLKSLRNAVGWTQGDLYAYSKVSVYQIGRIENGHEGPNSETLLALAQALGKYPSQLYEFKFPYKLNKAFPKVIKKKPGTTESLNQLLEDDFFTKPKSVSEVVKAAHERLGKKLKSADVSGALLILAKKRKMKITKNGSINLYQSR